MANFNNRQTKIKLQCERAQKEDGERERMATEGFTNHEIESYIQNKRMEPFRRPLTVHPIDENRHVVNPVDLTSTGLPGTHLVKSTAKDFNVRAQKKYDKYNDQKKTAREQEELARTKAVQFKENLEQGIAASEAQESTVRPSTTEVARLARKTQSKNIEKKFNTLIKTQNYRDHMREMEQGMDELNKMPKNSHYAEEFGFDKNMQELTDNTNFDHHMRANDLKWYNEAYVKYKSTMRK